MRRYLAVAVVLLCHAVAYGNGFDECPQFFPSHPPVVAQPGDQRALCFRSFAVLYSGQSKTPIFSAERLNRQLLGDAADEKRTNRFYPEARLPNAARAQLDDYKGSGFSRGHMSPAADMPDAESMAQSFSLANMVPQDQAHNSGAWSKIEKATRDYAKRADGDVFVITGPLFDQEHASTIGKNSVWVPQRIFKVVYTPSSGRAWAYLQKNEPGQQSLKPIPYSDFVQKTGLNLLGNLSVRD